MRQNRFAIKKLATWGVALVIGALLLYWFLLNQTWIFDRLAQVSWQEIFGLLFVWSIVTSTSGMVRYTQAKILGKHLSFRDWYGLTYVSNLLNLVLPLRGDLFITAYYLKSRYQLPPAHFISMAYGNSVLMGIVNGMAGAICLMALDIDRGISSTTLFLAMAMLLIGSFALMFLPDFLPRLPLRPESWLMRNLQTAAQGWVLLRSRPSAIFPVSSFIALNLILHAVWTFLSFHCLNVTLDWYTALLISAVAQTSFLVHLLPGNLGINESAMGLISMAAGYGFDIGVTACLLQRVISLSGYFFLGSIFSILMTLQPGGKGLFDGLRAFKKDKESN